MSGQLSVKRYMQRTVFAVIAFAFITIAGMSSSVFAETPPPVDSTAPVATFDFSATTPTDQQFTVHFDKSVDPVDAINPQHYFLLYIGTQVGDSTAGTAAVTYNPLTRNATVTVSGSSVSILAEGVSVGVQGVHAATGSSLVARTIGSATLLVAPGRPGVPTVTSGENDKSIIWAWTAAVDGGQYPSGVTAYGYALSKDGQVVGAGTTAADVLTVTTTVVDDGTYALRVWAIDAAGNVGDVATSADTVIATPVTPPDTTGPDVTVIIPAVQGNTFNPTVDASADTVSYQWSTAASATDVTITNESSAAPTVTFLKSGSYVFTLVVRDAAGNPTTRTFTVTYDATDTSVPPVMGNGSAGGATATPVSDEGTVSDAVVAYVPPAVAPYYVTPAIVPNDFVYTPPATSVDTEQSTATDTSDDTATTSTASAKLIDTSANDFKILGLPWFWWLVMAGIVATAWFWVGSIRRRS